MTIIKILALTMGITFGFSIIGKSVLINAYIRSKTLPKTGLSVDATSIILCALGLATFIVLQFCR